MSFTDLMESGRGPGVIGTLIALLVLAGFGALFMFAFDEGLQGGDQSIEALLRHQAREIDDLELSIAADSRVLAETPGRQVRAGELRRLKRESAELGGRLEHLKTRAASANDEVVARTREFDTYKDAYRAQVRRDAKGEKIDRLQTRKGVVYENVSIREVNAIGMQIIHDAGHKRIAYEDLPGEIQERFQFDPKQKADAVAMEEAMHRQHDTDVARAAAETDRLLAVKRERDAEARREEMMRSLSVKQDLVSNLADEIDRLQHEIENEGMKRISRAPQMRMELAAKRGRLRALQIEIHQMQSRLQR
jgi:hypothetical protein